VKRFSWPTFIGVTLGHLYVTSELLAAGIRASKLTDPPAWYGWLPLWCWITQPLLMPLRSLGPTFSNSYRAGIALIWSICFGLCFGFLAPRLLRWSANRRSQQRS
jgi:hypothetical protein